MVRRVRKYSKAEAKWPWRDYLTDEERKELAVADEAKKRWRKANMARASIVNRAIQRAKYHAKND